MKGILSGVLPNNLHGSIIERLKQTGRAVVSGIGTPLSKAYFISDIIKNNGFRAYIYIVHHENEISELITSLRLYKPDITLTPLLQGDTSSENQDRIISYLNQNLPEQPTLYITSADFIFQNVPLQTRLSQELFRLRKGDLVLLRDFYERLLEMGYRLSEDPFLSPGTYRMEGGSINVCSVERGSIYKLELLDNTIDKIYRYDQQIKQIQGEYQEITLYPLEFQHKDIPLLDYSLPHSLIISDELDLHDEKRFERLLQLLSSHNYLAHLKITSFPDEQDIFEHLQYLSVIKYYTITDFVNDIREKYIAGWKIVLLTKNKEELIGVTTDHDIPLLQMHDVFVQQERGIIILEVDEDITLPRSFQNTGLKIAILTDREIYRIKKRGSIVEHKTVLDFITSLKPGDYVVHNDHGIGRFIGIDKKIVDGITKEYIEIQYAGNDKLFIPTDQAGKVSRFIAGSEENEPKLTRLDSGEWALMNKKVRKETEKIAKELLQLYAKRKMSKGHAFLNDTKEQLLFEETFAYEETPGQMKAIKEVKEDMEKSIPMDRLVCGDVGFGKTEVALRAAFKAFSNGKQVAFISPVTILADQHYKTFKKRMEGFNVRIEMMSRFQSVKEQNDILKRLEKGEVDIVIGTHRLLQDDVKFKNLGLVIVDEEQKFGVKQKEKIKQFRCNVDIITLTATPIPRTLNMSLNKLRDITTITTPPPGRLPIITQVRKYSDTLIREAILFELQRHGQVYFLHNKVQTIESITDKLRILIPEARFIVAHGQMDSKMLENRVMAFKEGQYDVLVSSTIIENGIDLPNANTLIVNDADQFGLAQLYQLRGRVGRGKQQAYTYLLYSGQRLSVEAKKRLRAIVEASELGSGFQIAMKDLEIRGAGDILGAQQHGVIKSVGVSHFVRMLNQMVEEMKTGKIGEELEVRPEENITVELPLTSFIPETYIPDYKEKIAIYQKMSSMDNLEELRELRQSIQDEYGSIPDEVKNLFKVLEIKIMVKEANLLAVRVINYTLQEKFVELHMSKKVTPYQIMHLLQGNTQNKWVISGDRLKINLKELSIDWYEGLKKSLQLLIDGKDVVYVEKVMKKGRDERESITTLSS